MSRFIYGADSIAVSVDFIKNKMPAANGAYVKVYLYTLCAAALGEEKTDSQIARDLGLLESDVVNAYEFWAGNGAITKTDGAYIIGNGHGFVAEPKPETPERDMEKTLTEDRIFSDLVLLAQETLGRTLSDTDIRTLYWFYDELGFSAEVICMLLEYCVSKDKRNMNYIEKVAIGWHQNGVTTMEAAENYMKDERERSGYLFKLRKLLGIADRKLSKTEELYLKSWHDDCGMSEEMVALAYEYCVMQTSKLSFPYMNAIIKRWHGKNIISPQAAKEDHDRFRADNGALYDKELAVYKDSTDYNYTDLENRMQKKYDD